jgi:hypothetical protein
MVIPYTVLKYPEKDRMPFLFRLMSITAYQPKHGILYNIKSIFPVLGRNPGHAKRPPFNRGKKYIHPVIPVLHEPSRKPGVSLLICIRPAWTNSEHSRRPCRPYT